MRFGPLELQFRQEALERDGALFTPERPVWSLSVLDDLHARFVGQPDVSKDAFDVKFKRQLAGAPDLTIQIAAEVVFVHLLIARDVVSPRTKRELVSTVLSWAPTKVSVPPDLDAAFDSGLVHPGQSYLIRRPFLLAFLIDFARQWKRLDPPLQTQALRDPAVFRRLVFDIPVRGAQTQQHALLHLVHPDAFEPIVSQGHKQQIVERFREAVTDRNADVDRQLAEIRKHLEPEYGVDFSFYKPELKALWLPRDDGPVPPPGPPPPRPPGPTPAPPLTDPITFEWLEATTLWTPDRLRDIVDALQGKTPQVVVAGPPGTGKTWLAMALARYLTQDRTNATKLVQFHPSYSYEEFVGGLRPAIDNGVLQFRPVPGVLLSFCADMMRDGGEPWVLLIDEMNRANLSKVFGELMHLLEYRGKEIDLQYFKKFALPPKLFVIGTMNTADRSIRSIDIALRRRFDVFECHPDPLILERYYADESRSNEVDKLIDGFVRLNGELTSRLDRHHAIGHTFFMDTRFTVDQLRKVWRHKIGPLIEEYFFDQPDIVAFFQVERFWPIAAQ